MPVTRACLLWINRFISYSTRGQPRPAFYEISEICPELGQVTAAHEKIRREAEALLTERSQLPTYQELDQAQMRIAGGTPQKWSVFFLNVFGFKPRQNRSKCPETCAALEGIPNLLQAFFSILDANKSIPEHKGPYLGYLRYHLGLVVPSDNPPTIMVNGETYAWKEGEAILFDDCYPHRVDNNSSHIRIVLIVDIRRPMPFFPDIVNRVVTNVLSRWGYAYGIYRKINRD